MLSLLYYLVVTTLWFIVYCWSWVAFILCYPFDKRRVVVHKLSCLLVDAAFIPAPLMKRKVEGLENLDPKQTYVIAINHNSMVDILALYKLPLIFKWVSKREVYKIPLVGRLLFMHGDIVINRSNPKEAMQFVHEKGMKWLKRGASVSIFPEGTRSKDGEIHNFKAGAFILAKDAGVPILPVVMDGTNTMARKNMLINWRNQITLRVLPPVSAEEVAERSIKEVMNDVHDRMVEALADIRANKQK